MAISYITQQTANYTVTNSMALINGHFFLSLKIFKENFHKKGLSNF